MRGRNTPVPNNPRPGGGLAYRVTVIAKCFGPDASAVIKGRLMSVLVVLLSSHLACTNAAMRKRRQRGQQGEHMFTH
jgi:hypothetical protein